MVLICGFFRGSVKLSIFCSSRIEWKGCHLCKFRFEMHLLWLMQYRLRNSSFALVFGRSAIYKHYENDHIDKMKMAPLGRLLSRNLTQLVLPPRITWKNLLLSILLMRSALVIHFVMPRSMYNIPLLQTA